MGTSREDKPDVPSCYFKTFHYPGVSMMLYDDKYLYFASELEDSDLFGMSTGHDSLFNEGKDDVVELFIKPDDSKPGYWEFHAMPQGNTRDYFYARRNAGFPQRWIIYNSDMKAAVSVKGTVNHWEDKDTGWTVEMAIPISAFLRTTSTPKPGDRWKFMVGRYDCSVYLEKGLEHSTSAILSETKFHQYEAYPYFVFGN